MERTLKTFAIAAALAATVAARAQSTPTFQFDIPATDLPTAVQKFAATIGGDAVFDHYAARGVHTQPVSGNLTPESALNQMLAGTGLYYRYNAGSRRVVVAKR